MPIGADLHLAGAMAGFYRCFFCDKAVDVELTIAQGKPLTKLVLLHMITIHELP